MTSTPAAASTSTLTSTPYLRAHGPGDIGWVISRHGRLYADEFGYNPQFEALVARIGADFLDRFDPEREACWIAERLGADGQPERLGCVFLVQARNDLTGQPEPGVGQLRLLLLEPAARGLGLGARLVATCTERARTVGFQRLRLWTQNHLSAARTLYEREGYRLVSEQPNHSFGLDLVSQFWEMRLDSTP